MRLLMEDLNQDLEVQSSQEKQAVISDTEVETTEQVDTVDSATTEDEGSEEHIPKGIKKRFNKLTRDREAAVAETNYWKQVALEREQAAKQTNTPVQATTERPTLAQHGYDMDAYTEALTDWKVDQKLEAKLEARLVQQENKVKQSQVAKAFETRAEVFAKQVPDFAESIQDAFEGRPLDPDTASVIHESELGPEIAYYLSQNEEVLARLHTLKVPQRLVEIGKIETRLSGTAKDGSATRTNKQTSAPPPPIKTTKGNLGSVVKPIVPTTFAEYEKMRLAEWRKRNS
jgi:hypothetical protein